MRACRRSNLASLRRFALVAGAMIAALVLPAAARAQQTSKTPVIIGSLANFDAVNDNPEDMQGFEIQLEGLDSSDITRVFGQTLGTCYIRYCIGSITPYGTPGVGSFGVRIRWTANYDAANQVFTTPLTAPGSGAPVLGGGSHGTPSVTAGAIPPRVVTGESCWTLGLGGSYEFSGCEHFGVSTLRPPTAPPVYHWLKGDPLTGALAYPTVTVAPGVTAPVAAAIAQPIAVVDALGQVQAVIQGVPPVVAPIPHRYGKAEWVKVYKTEIDRDADLDELVGGHANNVVPNAQNVVAETEWKLLQYDRTNPTSGTSQLKNGGSPNSGSQSVIRRYEFYKYTGPTLSGTSNKTGTRLDLADGENSACPRDAAGECTAPGPGELGDFIGAQMAAQNLVAPGVLVNQTITFTLPAALTFGDADFTVTGTGGGSGNPVLFAASGACANTATPGVLTIVGAGSCLVTATQDGNASFAPAPPVTLSVNVAKGSATVTIDAASLSQIYSGTLKTVSTTTAPAGLAVDVSFTGTPQGAGSYPLTATINDLNYAGSATATLAIAKADATFSISGYSGVYDAAAHGATGSASGVLAEDLSALLHFGAGFTNVPGGAVPWTFDGDANYNASNGSADVAISVAPSTVSVTCPASAVYTGLALTPCTASASGVGLAATDASASLVYANNLNAGAATATASFAGDANHSASTGSGGFAIGVAASTVTVNCPPSVGYTGAAATPCTASASGAGLAAIDVSGSLVYASNVNVGSATATANFAGDANHSPSTGAGGFTIGAAASTVSVICTPRTYTGAGLTGCTATASGVGLAAIDVSASLLYANNINAGLATATASYAGDANHSGSTGAGSFTIAQASSSVSVICAAGQIYTGAALTGCTAAASGIGLGPVDVSASLVYANNVNAGAASATASFAGDANHTGSTGLGGFAISPASSTTVVSCPASVAFTGAPIAPCSAAATGAGGLNVALPIVYANNVNAGTATASATFAGDANHTGSAGSSSFVIVAPPPPTTLSMAPISDQSNREGDEVEFTVVVTGGGLGGRFSASGLPAGLKIDDEAGEIHGHITINPATVAPYSLTVTVTYTRNGVSVSRSFVWKIAPAAPKSKSGKG